jgi:hypothetical protein
MTTICRTIKRGKDAAEVTDCCKTALVKSPVNSRWGWRTGRLEARKKVAEPNGKRMPRILAACSTICRMIKRGKDAAEATDCCKAALVKSPVNSHWGRRTGWLEARKRPKKRLLSQTEKECHKFWLLVQLKTTLTDIENLDEEIDPDSEDFTSCLAEENEEWKVAVNNISKRRK